MNDYLKNISNINEENINPISYPQQDNEIPVSELTEQPSMLTSSPKSKSINQTIQDNIQYSSPQSIKLRRYTLRKG